MTILLFECLNALVLSPFSVGVPVFFYQKASTQCDCVLLNAESGRFESKLKRTLEVGLNFYQVFYFCRFKFETSINVRGNNSLSFQKS